MPKNKTSLFVVLALLMCGLALGVTTSATEESDARKARIIANLKLAYPQLEKATVEISNLEASEYEGLDQGSFSVNSKPQSFLVSIDDKKFYFVNGPVDVSRSQAEIETAVAQRVEAEAKQADERRQRLASSTEGMPMRGNPEAPITIIEFSDFQCPYCGRGAQTVEKLLEKYPNDIKFVFKHFPLRNHPWAKPAAIAAHCAAEQNDDAFWAIHDNLFLEQKKITPGNVIVKTKEFLVDSGIDMGAWLTCAKDATSEAYKAASAQVEADMRLGQSMGVSGTPGFFVNGRFLNGAQPPEAFEPLIAAARKDS